MKFIALLLLASAAHATDSCPSGEKLVAECILPGKIERKASICFSKGQTTSLSYYFKKGENTELEVNFSEKNKLNRWTDDGTYTRYFWFTRGAYSYIIGVPQETLGAVSFLWVKRKGDTKISDKGCVSNSFGDKDVSHPYIKDIPSSETKGKGFPFF